MPDVCTVVNLHREPFDVYIGRAGKGRDGYFGNPFKLPKNSTPQERLDCMRSFHSYFLRRIDDDDEFRCRVLALAGKRLGCFCKPGPCHGDFIATWVNNRTAVPHV